MPDAATIMDALGKHAKEAAKAMRMADTCAKNDALTRAAAIIRRDMPEILAANAMDMQAAEDNGLEAALKDRLLLNTERLDAVAEGLQQIAALPDPVGAIDNLRYRPSGIQVGHMRVPLGVIGIIYESRPNVTADAAALCLKSGNAAILRGGSEAIHSNRAIAACLRRALIDAGLPQNAIQLIDSTDRALVGALLKSDAYIDVIIPRGGKSLIKRVTADSRVPVIKHLDGICHVYIDADADAEMALNIAVNAKTHRYGVCNAMETLLIHQDASDLTATIVKAMIAKGVEVRGCEKTRALCNGLGRERKLAIMRPETGHFKRPLRLRIFLRSACCLSMDNKSSDIFSNKRIRAFSSRARRRSFVFLALMLRRTFAMTLLLALTCAESFLAALRFMCCCSLSCWRCTFKSAVTCAILATDVL